MKQKCSPSSLLLSKEESYGADLNFGIAETAKRCSFQCC